MDGRSTSDSRRAETCNRDELVAFEGAYDLALDDTLCSHAWRGAILSRFAHLPTMGTL